MGLEVAGVQLTNRGYVKVNERLETTAPASGLSVMWSEAPSSLTSVKTISMSSMLAPFFLTQHFLDLPYRDLSLCAGRPLRLESLHFLRSSKGL
jgi:hypothetical protein